MASSSSAAAQNPTPFAATAAPPPTPSFNSDSPSPSSTTPDFLSHLLHRLPPSLSLSRLSSSSTVATPPLVSLSDPNSSSSLLSASTERGFFQLAHHSIPSHLPPSAESAALSLFSLPPHQKQLLFPSNWPLGHDIDDDDDTESFCLDSSSFSTQEECLREFTLEMEKLGFKVLGELASAAGFNNPPKEALSSLLWISNALNKPGRVYPYALGLHYQFTSHKHYSLFSDSGRLTLSALPHSVFVTLGDIAQVWSNGKLKKVVGRPFPSWCDEKPCITMSLLITHRPAPLDRRR